MEEFDVDSFVDGLGVGLATEASDEVRNEIFTNDALASEILGLQHEAKDGLRRAAEKIPHAAALLEQKLRDRKTRIVKASQKHAYSIEKLVARAIDQVVTKAREIG